MNTTTINPCEQIALQFGGMFNCSRSDGHVRIRTPFLYPDGDVIDLYCVDQGGKLVLTDFGETMRWLRTQTSGMRKTPKQKMLIADVCMTHKVNVQDGMLFVRVESFDSIADSMLRVGQAAMRIADLYFTMRTRAVQSATDEVEDYLRERHAEYKRGVSLRGESGRDWSVDFEVQSKDYLSLVQVLSTGSRAAARGVVNQTVAMWFDIHPANDRVMRVSLFDDTSDVWDPADYTIVQKASDQVARWSRPDEFERAVHIKEAA